MARKGAHRGQWRAGRKAPVAHGSLDTGRHLDGAGSGDMIRSHYTYLY
jgi:hypothetical protein